MGQTKGQSQAHKGFTDEMCKRTVINRACKQIINSSDDAYLFDESDKQERTEREAEETIENNANAGEPISFAEEAQIVTETEKPEYTEPKETFEPNVEEKTEKQPKMQF